MLKKIFLILLVILLHFNGINNMSGYINDSNGDLFKFLNLLFLYFSIYVLITSIVFVILLSYDFLINISYARLELIVEERGRLAIKERNIRATLIWIRIDYSLSKIYYKNRLGWVTYGTSPNDSKVWRGIINKPIKKILNFLISIPAVISLEMTSLLLLYLNDSKQFLLYIDLIKTTLFKLLSLEINFGEVLTRLPAMVALITIIPTLFFFYFYNQQREVKRVIDEKHGELFREIVLKHEELSNIMDKLIYDFSMNMDYVINDQDIIVKSFLNKMIPNYSELDKSYYFNEFGMLDKHLNNFVEIKNMARVIKFLLQTRDKTSIWKLFVKRYDILQLCTQFSKLDTEEKIDRLFFTKKGMSLRLSSVDMKSCTYDINSLDEETTNQLDVLLYDIYESIRTLYSLKKYNDSLIGYLYPTAFEKTLLKIFIKK